jgi:hypothetical protein
MNQQAKFNITDWGGTAEVLGYERRFGFRANKGRLALYGLGEEEAKLVLATLCLGGPAALGVTGDRDAKDRAYEEASKAAETAPIHVPPPIPVPGAPEPVVAATLVAAPAVEPKPEPAPEPAPVAEAPKRRATRKRPEASAPQEPQAKPTEALPPCPACGKELHLRPDGGVVCFNNHCWLTLADLMAGVEAMSKADFDAKKKGNGTAAGPVLPGEPDPWQLAPPGEAVDAPPKPKTGALDATVLAELKKAARLGEVLGKLIDSGVTSASDLVALCSDIKAEVPVLSRIPDLETRIPRTLEVMGHTG